MRRMGWKKQSGKIALCTGAYMIVFLVILVSVQLQMRVFMLTAAYMEDALATSNLASAVADVREYGKSHIIRIKSPDEAYRIYCEALKQNLSLDDNWESRQKKLISGTVEILKYEIYNVEKNNITIYSYGAEGESVKKIPNGMGSVYTPEGVLVESTSVYSKIGFPVEGLFGIKIYAEKEKTVDIVANRTGGN